MSQGVFMLIVFMFSSFDRPPPIFSLEYLHRFNHILVYIRILVIRYIFCISSVPPSSPETVTLVNLSMTTTSIITDGDTITFVCSGDVGKPPGQFRFQNFRSDHILYKNYTPTSTSISEISDNCSYYRTSYIILQITSEDNKAVIRCVVESPLSDISMFVDTEPLEVYCE